MRRETPTTIQSIKDRKAFLKVKLLITSIASQQFKDNNQYVYVYLYIELVLVTSPT